MHRVDVVGAFVERDWCLCDASRCDSWCWRGCWCGAFAVRVGAGVAQSAMLDWCRLGAGLECLRAGSESERRCDRGCASALSVRVRSAMP